MSPPRARLACMFLTHVPPHSDSSADLPWIRRQPSPDPHPQNAASTILNSPKIHFLGSKCKSSEQILHSVTELALRVDPEAL